MDRGAGGTASPATPGERHDLAAAGLAGPDGEVDRGAGGTASPATPGERHDLAAARLAGATVLVKPTRAARSAGTSAGHGPAR
ncbi:hypothetical protein QZN11_30310 [Streptomyces gramineus]|uniref:hypothetical protein n=1 Tax=Streptomyces gramineus TaxID=910542 RepID=UPI00398A8AD1